MRGGEGFLGDIYIVVKDLLVFLFGGILFFVYFLIKFWRINFNFKKCGKFLLKKSL